MRRHWSKWLAIAASMGLFGLAIISYQRFFVGECFLTQNSWYQVIVRDGNLGLVRVAISFSEDRPEGFNLEEQIMGWRRMPIAGRWRFLNRVTNPMPSISLRENEINCTMYAVATWPLLVAFIAWPAWRNRWRALPLWREIIWPSDRSIELRPFLRKTKRWAVAMAFLVFWMSAFCWAFDYPSQPMQSVQFINAGVPTKLTMPGAPGSLDDQEELGWTIEVLDGSLSINHSSNRGGDNQEPGWEIVRFGFRLAYRYDWAALLRGKFSRITPFNPGFSLPTTLETSITFPLWLPTIFCFLIIIVSFLRGPWRRHKRAIDNCCLRCGYNLRGLIEPRCPECGTGIDTSTGGWDVLKAMQRTQH